MSEAETPEERVRRKDRERNRVRWADPEYRAKENERHRERRRSRMREEGTEGVLVEQALYRKERGQANPELHRQATRACVAAGVAGDRAHRMRTPPNQMAEERAAIRALYTEHKAARLEAKAAGQRYPFTIDHVVPIDHRKRLVGGLHVMANLQVLHHRQNVIKERGHTTTSQEQAEDYVARGLAVWSSDIDEHGNVDWSRYPDHSPA